MSSGHYCDDCGAHYTRCVCKYKSELTERLKGSYSVQEQEAGDRLSELENTLEYIARICTLENTRSSKVIRDIIEKALDES